MDKEFCKGCGVKLQTFFAGFPIGDGDIGKEFKDGIYCTPCSKKRVGK